MSYSFKDLAEEVLNKENKPMSVDEIWTRAVELTLDKKLGTKGKTPWKSLGAQIYTELKEGSSRFKQISKRPALFALANQNYSEKEIISIEEETLSLDKENYHERDLHPVLVKYVSTDSHFRCLTKTIYHEKARKSSKNTDKWMYPDLIGVYMPFDDFDELTLSTVDIFNEKSYKVFSFEMKQSISLGNLRECFFQAVSNSSWTNEGYLVAPKVKEDEEFLSEMAMLNNAFGIGLIKLNIEFPEQSEIMFYSKQRNNLDINMLNKLIYKNSNVREVFGALVDCDKLKQVIKQESFDRVFNDEEYNKYIKEKKLI